MNPIRQSAIDTINAEAAAVQHLVEQLTDDFEKAVQAILTCKGKVIVTGMGKSGLIGKKIAATLASTGTPAFFMHPGEAYHGDLGMIESKDIVLAIALINERHFKAEDYAVFHPGGSLGRRLLTKVQDVMRKDNLPCVSKEMTLGNVIIAISDARLGIAAIVEDGKLIGVITDGDVRRAMTKYKENFFNIQAQEIMTRTPKTILPTERIVVAEEMMRKNKIHSIIVVDEENHVVGIVEFFNVSIMG